MLTLEYFVDDFADALVEVDRRGIPHKNFRPGIGPYGESDAIKVALIEMRRKATVRYANTLTKRQPDLLIPSDWMIEFKIIRPFGDNGKEAESWSQNLLHPYAGNTSLLGDCLKLLNVEAVERKAVVVFGYEHDPAIIPLEPCVKAFEILAPELLGIILSSRIQRCKKGLIHPVHQTLWVFGWEVLSQDEPKIRC
ncbi:MAG: hypothetical protein AB1597_05415 [Chloroflexota bacterium]